MKAPRTADGFDAVEISMLPSEDGRFDGAHRRKTWLRRSRDDEVSDEIIASRADVSTPLDKLFKF